MKSVATPNPFDSLSSDAMYDLALRLPAAGSEKPWRDLGSLASTCKILSTWKTECINQKLKLIWSDASEQIPGPDGWRHGLEIILADFQDPSKRLFLEPVLRQVVRLRRKAAAEKASKAYPDFLVTLYAKREAATLKEIRRCFDACGEAADDKRRKLNLQLVETLPSLLGTLQSAERSEILQRMFRWFDADKKAGRSVARSGALQTIREALKEDESSKALLELGLVSRGLLPYKLDVLGAGYSLGYIPDKQRWAWVSENAPEFIETEFGLQVLLADPACRDQLIAHLGEIFFGADIDAKSYESSARVFALSSKLAEIPAGENLVESVCRCFLKSSKKTASDTLSLDKDYLRALLALMPIAETYLGKKEKKILFAKAFEIAGIAMMAKNYTQFTCLLLAMARHDPKLSFRDLTPIPKDFWKSEHAKPALWHALKHAADVGHLKTRRNYVDTLVRMACFVENNRGAFYDKFKAESLKSFQDPKAGKKIGERVLDSDAGSES